MLPSIKERLWYKLRRELAKYFPERKSGSPTFPARTHSSPESEHHDRRDMRQN